MPLCCCVSLCVCRCVAFLERALHTHTHPHIFCAPPYVKTLSSISVGVLSVCGVSWCESVSFWNALYVCVYSLQGSHHPNIIVGQLVSWAHNPVFSYPPFFMGHFYDYFYQRLQAEVCPPGPPGRQSQLSHSAGGPKGLYTGNLGHWSLYLETNSQSLPGNWAEVERGVEGTVW